MDAADGIRLLPSVGPARANGPAVHGYFAEARARRIQRVGAARLGGAMFNEDEAREKLAQLARIFAMQGMLGLFGHVSVYNPEKKRLFITPGMGSDKGQLRPEDMVPCDLDGKPQSSGRPPVEWPIHTALHAARADALAVAHLHPPHATLFTIAKREFQPVTLQGTLFSDGVPLYRGAQLVT